MLTVLILGGVLAAGQPVPNVDAPRRCVGAGQAGPVTERREEFNRAIREGDLSAIQAILTEDVVLVAGTHSDLFLDREAQLAIWRSEFEKGADRLVYVRTPECIERSTVTSMALETGRWLGQGADGSFAAGRYSAKWREEGGEWRLEAEIFMTDRCGGDACPE